MLLAIDRGRRAQIITMFNIFSFLWTFILSLFGIATSPSESPTTNPEPSAIPSPFPTAPPSLRPTKFPTGGPTASPIQPLTELPDSLACLPTPGQKVLFRLVKSDDNEAVREVKLAVPQESSLLCTLTLELSSEATPIVIPVARTYNGHPWERAGGRFLETYAPSELRLFQPGNDNDDDGGDADPWAQCTGTVCTVRLPVTGSNGVYSLQTRAAGVSASSQVQKARFLEAATFGATPQDLLSSAADSFSPAGWLQDQMHGEGLITSHRAWYRRHMNPHWGYHKPDFAAGLDPCDGAVPTTWRRHIFTVKDFGKEIRVQQHDATPWWRLSIDNQVRAIVPRLRDTDDAPISVENSAGTLHSLCGRGDEIRLGIVRMTNHEGKCRYLQAEDSLIQFPDGFLPEQILGGEPLPSLSESRAWQSLPYSPLPNSEYRPVNNKVLNPDVHCRDLPPYRYDGPPVFARTVDGFWLQFTPRISMQENSLEFPLFDGGAGRWAANQTRYCSNVVRNFVNEAGCYLATSDACTPASNHEDWSFDSPSAASGVVVCGSPDEVANDPSTGDSWLDVQSVRERDSEAVGVPPDTTGASDLEQQREFVWNTVALTAPDQLRQRVAWALVQIFSLVKDPVFKQELQTEAFVAYYDIFVRHAFGSYYDILREISFNPLMSENLSFFRSRSVGEVFVSEGVVQHADENFARELMQLFTIGMFQLHPDGTPILDATTNEPLRTYDNRAIRSMARVWTGYEQQAKRANVESILFLRRNRIDPMKIIPSRRDRFPKSGLNQAYIGDGYPLCEDLPEKAFLKLGAKYRLLGFSPEPEMFQEDPQWASLPNLKRVELQEGASGLYNLLCSPVSGSGTACSFPSVVTLESNLACPESSDAMECNVDNVGIVKVDSVYYEFIGHPCVQMAFFNDARAVTLGESLRQPTCANQKLPLAGAACCTLGNATAQAACAFAGERVTLTTAKNRCDAQGMELCSFSSLEVSDQCPHVSSIYNWRSDSCSIKAKIDAFGEVAIVHDSQLGDPERLVGKDTVSFFHVYWESPTFPSIENNCGGGLCELVGNICSCNTTVIETMVFSELPSNGVELLERLKIGAPNPAMFTTGKYRASVYSDYVFHSADGNCCNPDTVFEVVDPYGVTHFLSNKASSVIITGTELSFRNPPQFHSILTPEYSTADSENEVEALLQHLFYHPNVAPFLASHFIQRFGISTPSPRYVRVVANGMLVLCT